jgi:hypothetical protein
VNAWRNLQYAGGNLERQGSGYVRPLQPFGTGCDYGTGLQAACSSPEFTIRRGYRFDGVRFEVTIMCDGLQYLAKAEAHLQRANDCCRNELRFS